MKKTIYYTGLTPLPAEKQTVQDTVVKQLPTIEISYCSPASLGWIQTLQKKQPILVFLSKHGILGLKKWLKEKESHLNLDRADVWTVGQRTAEILKNELNVDAKVPHLQSAQGLIEEFNTLDPQPVILICGKNTMPHLPNWLKRKGWPLQTVPVYQTGPSLNHELRLRFRNSVQETIFFTSPSSVEGFLHSVEMDNFSSIIARLASLGSTTSRAIQAKGGELYFESEEANIVQSIEKLTETLASESGVSPQNVPPQEILR